MNMRQEVLILCVTLCLAVSSISCSEENVDAVNDVLTKSYNGGLKHGSRLRNYVKVNEYPFFAQVISTQYDNGYLCGGTLVSENHIITPASCVTDSEGKPMAPETLIVILGSDRVGTDGDIYCVSTVHVHPDFSPDESDNVPSNNIAVIALVANVTMSDKVASIDHAKSKDWESGDLSNCESLVWIGGADRKRKGQLGMVNYDCEEDMDEAIDVYFCASKSPESYCNQDFGLPVLCDGIVYGMNAGVGECFESGTQEIFINVTNQFIEDIINPSCDETVVVPILIAPFGNIEGTAEFEITGHSEISMPSIASFLDCLINMVKTPSMVSEYLS